MMAGFMAITGVKKLYLSASIISSSVAVILIMLTSCRTNYDVLPIDGVIKLGMVETQDGGNKLLQMSVTKIGGQPLNYNLTFDTGSGGMVIDANGILPASMITNSGFKFSGDST